MIIYIYIDILYKFVMLAREKKKYMSSFCTDGQWMLFYLNSWDIVHYYIKTVLFGVIYILCMSSNQVRVCQLENAVKNCDSDHQLQSQICFIHLLFFFFFPFLDEEWKFLLKRNVKSHNNGNTIWNLLKPNKINKRSSKPFFFLWIKGI